MPALSTPFDPTLPKDGVKPNFFLIGAARCGTTSLFHLIRQHPDVYMPDMKEPSFFCSYWRFVHEANIYCAQFKPGADRKARGEASHIYLTNSETPKMLKDQFPKAKLILILRNPTNRAHSLYHWMRRAGHERLATFEEALEAEDRRFEDPEFFKNCPQYFWNNLYVRSSYYPEQWRRYLEVFPEDQIFPLSLTELHTDPMGWTRKIYQFLGLDSEHRPDNPHLSAGQYSPMNPETRKRLDDHFQKVVTETNELAKRDLRLDGR